MDKPKLLSEPEVEQIRIAIREGFRGPVMYKYPGAAPRGPRRADPAGGPGSKRGCPERRPEVNRKNQRYRAEATIASSPAGLICVHSMACTDSIRYFSVLGLTTVIVCGPVKSKRCPKTPKPLPSWVEDSHATMKRSAPVAATDEDL